MQRKQVIAVILVIVLFFTPVITAEAASSFEGWKEDTEQDAWGVYSGTDWHVMHSLMNFSQIGNSAHANVDTITRSAWESTIRSVLKDCDSIHGMYPNEEYTELILAIIDMLARFGIVTAKNDDPCRMADFGTVNNAEQSILRCFSRIVSAERAYIQAHGDYPSVYQNDNALWVVVQGVYLGESYIKDNKEYSVNATQKWMDEHPKSVKDFVKADFGKKMTEKYTATMMTGSGQAEGSLQWPCDSRRVTSIFGHRDVAVGTSWHDAIDIGASVRGRDGDPIYAADGGVCTVSLMGYNSGRGNYCMIDHGNGIVTRYQHLSSIQVSVGDKVSKGQTIARMGNTGESSGTHLDFAVIVNGTAVDPLNYLH